MIKAKAKITVRDKGYNRLMAKFQNLDGTEVVAGLLEGETANDGTYLPDIGFFNEFGTKTIPQRPFMRGYVDGNKKKILNFVGREYGRMIDGTITKAVFIGRTGSFLQGGIQKSITDLRTPPNADSTIAQKGSSNPLIDTGQMRASIMWEER